MEIPSLKSVVTSLCAATAVLRNVCTFPTTQQTNPSPYDYDLGNFSISSNYFLDNSSQNYGKKDISLNTIDYTPINLPKKTSTTTKALTTTKKPLTTTETLTTTEKASTTTEYLTTTEKASTTTEETLTTTEKASTTTEETLTTTKNAPTTTEESLTTTGKILITAASSLIIMTITVALYTLKKYFYNSPEEQVLDMKELDFFKIKDNVNNEDNTIDLMAETPDDHLE